MSIRAPVDLLRATRWPPLLIWLLYREMQFSFQKLTQKSVLNWSSSLIERVRERAVGTVFNPAYHTSTSGKCVRQRYVRECWCVVILIVLRVSGVEVFIKIPYVVLPLNWTHTQTQRYAQIHTDTHTRHITFVASAEWLPWSKNRGCKTCQGPKSRLPLRRGWSPVSMAVAKVVQSWWSPASTRGTCDVRSICSAR